MIVAFVLFCFTFSSCKACKDEKNRDDTNESDPASSNSTSAIIERVQDEAKKAEEAAQRVGVLAANAAQAANKAEMEAMALPQKVTNAELMGLTCIYVYDSRRRMMMLNKEKKALMKFWKIKNLEAMSKVIGVRDMASETQELVDKGVMATIASAKAVWTAGKLVAQATDEATKRQQQRQ
jgi:hypothetical protein